MSELTDEHMAKAAELYSCPRKLAVAENKIARIRTVVEQWSGCIGDIPLRMIRAALEEP